MRRISGIDLNGWRDVAVRDWDPDEPDAICGPVILHGGVAGAVVRQLSGQLVGGPQATLAPHGRGNGWGPLGATDRRVQLADLCDKLVQHEIDVDAGAYVAAADALTRSADELIITVPDHAKFDEAAQGRLLRAFQGRRRVHRLLWRSVALFLYALERGHIARDASGARFRTLIHSSAGIEVQTFRLRPDNEHVGHLAPEREGYGTFRLPELGLRRLVEKADASVRQGNPRLASGWCERSMLGAELLFGSAQPDDRRIVRHDNGNWFEIVAPDLVASELLPDDGSLRIEEDLDFGDPVTATFFVSPLTEPLADRVVQLLGSRCAGLQRFEWNAVALGALGAGRLIEAGLPHYFDRLTPIKLAVLKDDQPHFEDLIASGATLPANREYVSPPYRDLRWARGKTEIDFFVLKGETEVRHWQARLDKAPSADVHVELRLRQTPGQSWAKLSLTSSMFEPLQRNPIYLDWETLNPDRRTPDEILEHLKTPPPSIPQRVIERPHEVFWIGNHHFRGILSAVEEMKQAGRYDLGTLADLLSNSFRDPSSRQRYWPIGTDGELPNTLSQEQKEAVLTLLTKLDAKLHKALRDGTLTNNHLLRCLTWTFTLCPDRTKRVIVEALKADLKGKHHPLLEPRASRTVVTQGAGRAITGLELLQQTLSVLAAREPNNDTLNAFAMILSRREEASKALSKKLVAKIADLVTSELRELAAARSFGTRLKNALLALAGLFRYRDADPFALLEGRDPLADKIRSSLDVVDRSLSRARSDVPRIDEKRQIIASIREFLEGHGDPNILMHIEELSD